MFWLGFSIGIIIGGAFNTIVKSLVDDVIMPLVLDDGRILRCDRPGMPSVDCLTVDPTESKKIFKLQEHQAYQELLQKWEVQLQQ